ncbi:MAG: energy transducer TonB, partial [Flavobacteriales bacterium]|nr:energy transducer TonB [Flavobacteriales bacterium]
PQQTTVIEIVDDEEEIEEELEIEDIELDEDTEIEIIEDEEDFEEDTPFMIVENMPAFGPCTSMRGDERHQCTQMEIIRYVSSNTKYPPIAKDAGIQGTVFVYFVVGKNGKVKDVKVLREVDPRLDKEAMRVVESLPQFEAGQQRGKSVSVQYTIPVKFVIR